MSGQLQSHHNPRAVLLGRKAGVSTGGCSRFLPIAACLNRQRLPLTPQVELQQDVLEDLVQTQFDVRPTATASKVRQDKFIKVLNTLTRWNPLPLLALRHFV